MIKFALCGNIACGKSTVEKIFSDKGIKVIDTDKISHFLLARNKQVLKAFKDYDIKDNSGNISREKLGKIVFNDIKLKNRLEEILHPQIRQKILEFFDDNSQEKYVIVSIPLLFEAKMEDIFDKIIFISCKEELRLERLIKRNNYTKDYAITRIKSQLAEDNKIQKSDFVIYNNGTLEELEIQIQNLIIELENKTFIF